jgi:hypothetical protein
VRLRHSQIPWSWITSLHLPLVLPNVAPNAAAKLPKVRLARAKHHCPRFLLFLWCAPCWWPGSAERGMFAKVPRKFCEGVGEGQSAFWREWPSKPCKKNAWEGDSGTLAACLQRYEEVIHNSLVWFGGDDWIFIRAVVAQHGFRER